MARLSPGHRTPASTEVLADVAVEPSTRRAWMTPLQPSASGRWRCLSTVTVRTFLDLPQRGRSRTGPRMDKSNLLSARAGLRVPGGVERPQLPGFSDRLVTSALTAMNLDLRQHRPAMSASDRSENPTH